MQHGATSLIQFNSPQSLQNTLSLIGKVQNICAINVGCYIKNATDKRSAFNAAKAIWAEAEGNKELCDKIKRFSPVAWQHINLILYFVLGKISLIFNKLKISY